MLQGKENAGTALVHEVASAALRKQVAYTALGMGVAYATPTNADTVIRYCGLHIFFQATLR